MYKSVQRGFLPCTPLLHNYCPPLINCTTCTHNNRKTMSTINNCFMVSSSKSIFFKRGINADGTTFSRCLHFRLIWPWPLKKRGWLYLDHMKESSPRRERDYTGSALFDLQSVYYSIWGKDGWRKQWIWHRVWSSSSWTMNLCYSQLLLLLNSSQSRPPLFRRKRL